MRKLLFCFVATVLAWNAPAQIREVVLNVAGGFDVVVEPLPGQLVWVTNDGYIVDMNNPDFSTVAYYEENNLSAPTSLPVTYLTRGRGIKRAFEGKVASIGDIKFEYSTKSGAYGKLSRVGNVPIDYYRGVFEDPLVAGKVKTIGPIHVTYYYATDPSLSGNPQDGIKAGLIKTINGRPYQYFSPFSTSGSGAQTMSDRPYDPRITGNMDMKVDGIHIHVLDRIPPAHLDSYFRRMKEQRQAQEKAQREALMKKEAEIKAEAEAKAGAKAEEEAKAKAKSEKK